MGKKNPGKVSTGDDSVEADGRRLVAMTQIDNDRALVFQILLWIGIIDQLSTTQANRALNEVNLPLPQFTILNHMIRREYETHTVMALANSFQQPQPGITKTVKKLLTKKLLLAKANTKDRRSRILTVTDSGRAKFVRAIAVLSPGIAHIFAGWKTEELRVLFAGLDRLKIWLDANRDLAGEVMRERGIRGKVD